MIYSIVYFVVGLILTLYWWNTTYKAKYEAAKASNSEIEENMVVILIAILLFFWPFALLYKIWQKIISK